MSQGNIPAELTQTLEKLTPSQIDRCITLLQSIRVKKDKTPIEVINFLNEVTGYNYKPVASNLKFIRARLGENYMLEDFKKVIIFMHSEWKGTEFEKYLRPATLFNATKWQGYLQRANRNNDTYKTKQDRRNLW